MKHVESSENSLVTLSPSTFYTRESKVWLRKIGPMITAHTVSSLGYRGELKDIDPVFATDTVTMHQQDNVQIVSRRYPCLDFGDDVTGARLPQRITHSLFTFFRKNVATGSIPHVPFDPSTALKDMLRPGDVEWQTTDVVTPNRIYAPGDKTLPGGIYTTGGDDPQLLMTTTNPNAALISTYEQMGESRRPGFALADPWDIAAACGSSTMVLLGVPKGYSVRPEQAANPVAS